MVIVARYVEMVFFGIWNVMMAIFLVEMAVVLCVRSKMAMSVPMGATTVPLFVVITRVLVSVFKVDKRMIVVIR